LKEIAVEELADAIKSLRNGKTPRHDRITMEMVK